MELFRTDTVREIALPSVPISPGSPMVLKRLSGSDGLYGVGLSPSSSWRASIRTLPFG